MENVLEAIDKFIKNWKEKDKVTSVLFSGSYAVGSPSKNSDVDVVIILDNDTKWEERGNKIVDTYLVEYIAKPLSLWQKILTIEEKSGNKLFSYMFSIATVITEKDNIATNLIDWSNKIVSTRTKTKLSNDEIEMMKYHIHDRFSDLQDAFESKSPSYNATYYFFLSTLINSFAKLENIDTPSTAKVYRFLKDRDFKKRYKMRGFSDNTFINLALDCYENPSIENIQSLSNYVSSKLGGFNPNNWSLRIFNNH